MQLRYPITLLAIFLYVLAFPPFSLGFLILPSLACLFWSALHTRSLKEALLTGFLTSVLVTGFGFYFVTYSVNVYGELPYSVSVFLNFLLGFVGEPQFPFLFVAARSARVRKHAWVLPIIFAVADLTLPRLFQDAAAYSVYPYESLRIWVRDVGLLGVNAFIAGFAWALLTLAIKSEKHSKFRFAPLLFFLCSLIALHWGGTEKLVSLRALLSSAPKWRALAVQANIGDQQKLAAERGVSNATDITVDQFLLQSTQALEEQRKLGQTIDFVFWPETAFPFPFGQSKTPKFRALEEKLRSWVLAHQVPLGFGTYDKDIRGKIYNAFKILTPQNLEEPFVYQKHILLWFGEYIPFTEGWQWFEQTFPQIGNFGRGPGATVWLWKHDSLGEIRLAPIICYEALIPSYTRAARALGAHALINVTNDSWFGETSEPEHHLMMSAFRSIETGIPQVRVTNTGYTALILPDGTIENRSKLFTEQNIVMEVPHLGEP